MASKKTNPAAVGAGRAPNSFSCLAAWNSLENTPSAPSIQELRVSFLARRYMLPPAMAIVLADLAFRTKEAR